LPDIDLVLFDIGGVLAAFAGLPVIQELTGAADELEVAARWLQSPWVRRFEAGGCTDEEFATGMLAEWGFPYTPEEFLENFLMWLADPFDGAEQLVKDTAARTTVGCLSNTNALHWRAKISHWPLTSLFEYRFRSYELKAVKPDAEIYERVIGRLPITPERVLFLDDNAVNVEGARAVGLRSEQVRGVAEARAALSSYGLLAES
jgi:HAD superfamily hydrolase (TIGR01509 family)